MKKEEILNKAKEENKSEDLYEKEVLVKAGNYGAIVAVSLATIFFIIQIFAGKGMNYGLYAIVFSITATNFTYKYIKLRQKHELYLSIFYILFVLLLSVVYIINIINSSILV